MDIFKPGCSKKQHFLGEAKGAAHFDEQSANKNFSNFTEEK
jgi:hypothetical protein